MIKHFFKQQPVITLDCCKSLFLHLLFLQVSSFGSFFEISVGIWNFVIDGLCHSFQPPSIGPSLTLHVLGFAYPILYQDTSVHGCSVFCEIVSFCGCDLNPNWIKPRTFGNFCACVVSLYRHACTLPFHYY